MTERKSFFGPFGFSVLGGGVCLVFEQRVAGCLGFVDVLMDGGYECCCVGFAVVVGFWVVRV